MPKLSFEIGLAVFGLVLTIVLVVLDKAEKLKGPVLYWLLALAAVMTLPLVLGNPLVAEASDSWKYWLRGLAVCVVALSYWAIGIWISPTSPKTVTSEPSHEVAKTVPVSPDTGNLNERAVKLANDIMRDLYSHGYQENLPDHPQGSVVEHRPAVTDSKAWVDWEARRSLYFRTQYLPHVLQIQGEFAQLHRRDPELDKVLAAEAQVENAMKAGDAPPEAFSKPVVGAIEIEVIAERLKALASQI